MASFVADMLVSPYGGKAFAAPAGKYSGGGELWVNLGSPFKEEVKSAPFFGALKPVCTKDQYDDLMQAVVKLLKEELPKHAKPGCCASCCGSCVQVCAPCIACGTCLCCCCMPCIVVCCSPCIACAAGSAAGDITELTNQIEASINKGQKVVSEKTEPWPTTVTLKMVGMADQEILDGDAAKDQDGNPLKGSISEGETTRSGYVWPPNGVNLIFEFPEGSNLKSTWPPTPGQAEMIGNGQ